MRKYVFPVGLIFLLAGCAGMKGTTAQTNYDDAYFSPSDIDKSPVYGKVNPYMFQPAVNNTATASNRTTRSYGQSYNDRFRNFGGTVLPPAYTSGFYPGYYYNQYPYGYMGYNSFYNPFSMYNPYSMYMNPYAMYSGMGYGMGFGCGYGGYNSMYYGSSNPYWNQYYSPFSYSYWNYGGTNQSSSYPKWGGTLTTDNPYQGSGLRRENYNFNLPSNTGSNQSSSRSSSWSSGSSPGNSSGNIYYRPSSQNSGFNSGTTYSRPSSSGTTFSTGGGQAGGSGRRR